MNIICTAVEDHISSGLYCGSWATDQW